MSKYASFLALSGIVLDQAQPQPLYRQLYESVRQLVLSGQLIGGTRLPPTRALSEELKVSRNTVVNAFEQLIAEGYLEGRTGAGTYVSDVLPESILQVVSIETQQANERETGTAVLSRRSQHLTAYALRKWMPTRLFRPGMPETDLFPFNIWRKLMSQHWQQPEAVALGYGPTGGYMPLRQAIARYLRTARGVRCQAEQVIIVSGCQQALNLATQLLTDCGDLVWMEDPGYTGAKAALRQAEVVPVPIPLDEEGIQVQLAQSQWPQARMVYVTPSHQYPSGVTMSLSRRLALLQWAAQQQTWILEDDYDSEYRYTGHPLAALQGLDQANRVIYIGTFSKVLFPGLRLGYMVVPAALAAIFAEARNQLDRGSPWITQMVLADFMDQGHFARHIRRMRTLYAQRQAVFLEAAKTYLKGILTVQPSAAGLHLVGYLPPQIDDKIVSQVLQTQGIDMPALSNYSMLTGKHNGLVIGYAGVDEGTIRATIKRMAGILRQML